MFNGRSDLAGCGIPYIGTGVLHIRCTGDRRVLYGNREMARDNIRHSCSCHIPALTTQQLRRVGTPYFSRRDYFLRRFPDLQEMIVSDNLGFHYGDPSDYYR